MKNGTTSGNPIGTAPRGETAISVNKRANANRNTTPATMIVDSTNPAWKKAAPGESRDWDDTLGAGPAGVPMNRPGIAMGNTQPPGNSG